MDNSRYEKGMQIMKRQLGDQAAENYIAKIKAFAPEFAKVNVEFPFGDLYSRNVIDGKTREMITIGVLTVLGYAAPELCVHIQGALQIGVTRDEVIEIITQMIAYCGFPAATNALFVAKEVFDELDHKK
jgi:4-carboxymuconolactone decarboxylase